MDSFISRFFQTRDELSLRNIRGGLWPVLLVFPLSVIIGDLRYFDLKMEIAGFQSYELMLFPLGLGSFVSIALILFIQLLNNRSALYSWLLFLALSLFGLGVLIFDSRITRLSGSFAYGLGDGLGYIIIFHRNNLYRKLGIQSLHELFARYAPKNA